MNPILAALLPSPKRRGLGFVRIDSIVGADAFAVVRGCRIGRAIQIAVRSGRRGVDECRRVSRSRYHRNDDRGASHDRRIDGTNRGARRHAAGDASTEDRRPARKRGIGFGDRPTARRGARKFACRAIRRRSGADPKPTANGVRIGAITPIDGTAALEYRSCIGPRTTVSASSRCCGGGAR